MRSHVYRFEQFILDLMDSTGIKNLSNRYSEIKRLMVRGEREINPYGSILMRKKMKLYVENGNFDGTKFKLEDDFMFLDKVGCCAEGLCEGDYYQDQTHIILCDGETRTEITYVYWAIMTDNNGNPFTTYNHSEALIKYIIWQWKLQQAFMDEFSFNQIAYLERNFLDAADFARGEDIFPTAEQFERMAITNQTEMMIVWTKFHRDEDGCVECSCLADYSELAPGEEVPDTNTAPTVDDNSVPLQLAPYYFSYGDFTNNYQDAENHLPGTLVLVSVPDPSLGYIYEISTTTPAPIAVGAGYEKNINEVSDLYFKLNQEIYIAPDGSLIQYSGENIYNKIDELVEQGYSMYQNGCNLEFLKEVEGSIPNNTDLFFFFDTGSIDILDAENLADVIANWFVNFQNTNDNFTGNYYILTTYDENWLRFGSFPRTGLYNGYIPGEAGVATTIDQLRWEAITKLPDNINEDSFVPRDNAAVFVFNDESANGYHSPKLSDGFTNVVPQPTASYIRDYAEFIGLHGDYNYFQGFLIPTILSTTEDEGAFALHAVAAIEGTLLTAPEITALNCPADLTLLITENPYNGATVPGGDPMTGLNNYGWGYDVSNAGPHSTFYTSANIDPILDTQMAGTGAQTTDQVVLTGTCLSTDKICFNFAVKEQSADELQSNTASFCFNVELVDVEKKIWSFQLDDLNGTYDINTVTQAWITANGTEHTEVDLMAGKDVVFSTVGRVGFAIQTGIQDEYKILQFGIDISGQFTRQYSVGEQLDVHLSNELYTPGSYTIKLQLK